MCVCIEEERELKMGTSTKDFRISGSVWLRYKILLCRPCNSRPHVCVCAFTLRLSLSYHPPL